MKVSSLNELKKELNELPQKQLVDLCINIVKFKKDNKELLDYLLFKAHDKPAFSVEVKNEIDICFDELRSQANLYYVKKHLRKLLRTINKYCKYLADKPLEADLNIYFCEKLKLSNIPYDQSQLLVNMYDQQIKKINKIILKLHEDVQQDYINELDKII